MEKEKRENYDVTIIGGGPAGYTAALEAAKRGLRVTMIERDRIGGTCLNRGCIPTQCLLRDLVAYSFLMAYDFIEKDQQSLRLNLKKIMERKNRVVDLLVGGTEKTLLSHGVSIFRGEGAFLNSQTITIHPTQSVIESKFFLIATGATPKPEPPFEINHESVWDTTDALHMGSVPESIAIVGNGNRAMTFADIFHYLGSHVNIITEGDRILPDQDREISSRYRKILKAKGIDLLPRSKVTRVDPRGDCGLVELTVETIGGTKSLTVEKVLVPGHRQANVEGLSLDRVGLYLKDSFIPVDNHLMTSIRGFYAIGDVISGKHVAHKAMADGIAVVKHLKGEGSKKMNDNLIPICLYTNPEVAAIGLTQEEAEKRGYNIEVGYFPFAAGARPIICGQGEGIIKVLVEKKYGEILGVHIIGPQATELISLAAMAMKNELGLHEMREMIYAHPSFSENLLDAMNDAYTMLSKK